MNDSPVTEAVTPPVTFCEKPAKNALFQTRKERRRLARKRRNSQAFRARQTAKIASTPPAIPGGTAAPLQPQTPLESPGIDTAGPSEAKIPAPDRYSDHDPSATYLPSDIPAPSPPDWQAIEINSRIPAWSGTFSPDSGLTLDRDPGGITTRLWSENSEAEAQQAAQNREALASDRYRQSVLPDHMKRTPDVY